VKPQLIALVVLAATSWTVAGFAQGAPDQCAGTLASTDAKLYTDAVAAKLYADNVCSDRTVVCVDATGFPVPGEERNPKLQIGDTLTVRLFGPDSCASVLTVRTDSELSDTTLFSPAAAGAKVAAAAPPPAPPPTLVKLAETKVVVSQQTDAVNVVIARTDKSNLSIDGVRLTVMHPRYLLDVGLLVPFTYPYRQVNTQRMPGVTDQVIRQESTIHPSAAITLNLFPFGQFSQARFSGYHGLGLQVGIGADLRKVDDEFYFGPIWEIVPGAGLSFGLSLLRMDGLQPDYPAGSLVDPNDVPKDTSLKPGMYFGFSVNTQVFQTALDLGSKIRVPQ